tara:strand:+ start:22794 stop:23525 length:732 start_codon:yes stop_codon:yes gene_type:complete
MTGDRFRYVLFNRDEGKSRSEELPPKLFQPPDSPAYLAPVDPQSGGTWIAVNEYGLVASVLNYYDAIDPTAPPRPGAEKSRGTLPPSAVAHKHPEDALEAIASLTQSVRFDPFLLMVQSADGQGGLLSWNGVELNRLVLPEVRLPLTTSSWKSAEITAYRRDLFHEVVTHPPALHQLLEFHGFYRADQPAFGPSMVREDANTRSLTMVRIGADRVSMRHQYFSPENACFLDCSEIQLNRRFSK